MHLSLKTSKFAEYILAFIAYLLFAFLFLGIVFRSGEVAVFVDAKTQYVAFMNALNSVMNGDSLLHTMNFGLGENFFPIFSYYLSNPLIIFFTWLGNGDSSKIINNLVAVHIALSSLAMFIYLRSETKTSYDFILGLSYGFGAYVFGFIDNYMWYFSYSLLPILAMMINSFLRDRKGKGIILLSFLLIVSNYYSSVFTVLTGGIYLVYQLLMQKSNAKKMITSIIHYVILVLIGLMMSMFIIYPTLQALSDVGNKSINLMRVFELIKINRAILSLPFSTFSGGIAQVYASSNNHSPLFYVGIMPMILALKYFIKADKYERWIMLILMVVLIAPFAIKAIDFMYNFFYFPVWFNYRYAFMISFFIIHFAQKGIHIEKEMSSVVLWTILLLLSMLVFVPYASNRFLLNEVNKYILFINLLLLILIFLFQWKRSFWLFLIITCLDLGFTNISVLDINGDPFQAATSRYFETHYIDFDSDMCSVKFNDDSSFNTGMYHSFRSQSGFSSTISTNAIRTAELLNAGTTRFNKVLFGGRYALDVFFGNDCKIQKEESDVSEYIYGYQEIYDMQTFKVYQNKDVYKFGFITNYYYELEKFNKLNFIEKDVVLLNAVIMDNIDTSLEEKVIDQSSLILLESKAEMINAYTGNLERKYRYIPQQSGFYYIKLEAPMRIRVESRDWTASYNASILSQYDLSPYYNEHGLHYIGYINASEEAIEIFASSIENPEYIDYLKETATIYVLPGETLFNSFDEHKDDIVNVKFEPNQIKLELGKHDGGIAILPLTYDSNWKIKIDNIEAKSIKVNGGLMGVKVTPTSQGIELYYVNQDISIGFILSIFGLLVFLLYIFILNKSK